MFIEVNKQIAMRRCLPEQSLPSWRRGVLKVGSSLLAADATGLTTRFAQALADFVASSYRAGRQVVVVSSGAVAAGRDLSGARQNEGYDLGARQVMASLGQTSMIALWQSLWDRPVAQVLLTHDDLRHRRRYLNARATLLGLLALDMVPVVNENDTVCVDELTVGDNDNLAAIVAILVDADILLIASDVNALYSADPRRHAKATPIMCVESVNPSLMGMAGGHGSKLGTGGMRTKLEAAEKAGAAGIPTALFDGRDALTVHALGQGFLHGTLILAPRIRMQARKYWLLHAPMMSKARLRIDEGAVRALTQRGTSLLPRGVLAIEGEFLRGDLVEIIGPDNRRIARGLSQYAAVEVRQLAGHHSRDIEALLGYSHGEEVVHRDDLALIAKSMAGGA